MPETKANAILGERIDYGPELALFRVFPQEWSLAPFKPGQFATLGLPGSAPRHKLAHPEKKELDPEKWIKRAYSIASSPLQKDFLEFYIVMVRDGILTPRLWTLQVGDPLFLGEKITGQFTMDAVPDDKNIIFIGTGTGIAPYMSMIGTFLKPNQKQKWALLHGVRISQDLTYSSELKLTEKLCPNFHYFPIISRPHLDPTPWAGPTGHVQAIWESGSIAKAWGFEPKPENTHIFLCGSPGMIAGMTDIFVENGFKEHSNKEPGQIHAEKYWS